MLPLLRYKVICLLGLLIFSSPCLASLQKNQIIWNANEYVKHSKSQQEDAASLLNKISLNGNEHILDIGCGDGRFAAVLAKKVPKGQVIGIDPSDSMIEKANTFPQTKNLTFFKDKAETFSLNKRFDLIISIHALHWIKNQTQALNNISAHLKPDGKVYFIIAPSKEGLPFNRALQKTLVNWKKEFARFENNQYFYDMESYRKLLVEAGFHITKMSYTYLEKNYTDKAQLSGWLKQWLPHYKYLPTEKRELFLSNLVEAYLIEINAEPSQKINWGEYVMQIEATKNRI